MAGSRPLAQRTHSASISPQDPETHGRPPQEAYSPDLPSSEENVIQEKTKQANKGDVSKKEDRPHVSDNQLLILCSIRNIPPGWEVGVGRCAVEGWLPAPPQ